MSSNNVVLPPANGKKLWRVKRTPSSTNSNSNSTSHNNNHSQTSVECLNNSLKIVAAASKFTVKRPPLRRPKNKPGKPKDFVFVDLSPIKSDEEIESPTSLVAPTIKKQIDATPIVEQLPSPSLSIEDSLSSIDDSIFDLPTINGFESQQEITTTQQNYESSSQSNLTSPTLELGLGIMNLGIDWNQPQQTPIQPQIQEIPQAPKQPPQQPNFTNNEAQQQQQEFLSQQLFGYQQAMLQQHLQIQQLQQQLIQQQISIESQIIQSSSNSPHSQQLQSPFQEPLPSNPSPLKSSKKQTAGQFQFKSYQPKQHQRTVSEACIKKPQHNNNKKLHERSMSLPYTPSLQQQVPQLQSQSHIQLQSQQSQQSQYTSYPMQSSDSNYSDVSLDDFMLLNDQISIDLKNLETLTTPYSEISENDLNNKTNGGIEDYLNNQSQFIQSQQQSCFSKDDFELGTFVHI
ncbi:hypothetical protein KGF54_000940 [Candida jiufengensis]|uniref:uncharacterized protein n=1 Tax=Candida jiufengensis TaxID=497108 RepID=UPI00222533D4|nr:uncharacterized protein KGF54_000940 [Candida jiufengensis]KAI5956465.1 hypothetical protein KGF54_000940 [Candida jiufengensis]